jgi:peptidoglycan/xylan/chitin deacetylase (PgdA/CDA1 family)
MRVIIAGSREFNDYKLLEKECNKIFKQLVDEGFISYFVEDSQKEIEIISGTANGADKLGERFAKEYEYPIKRFPANWDLYGKSAGYRRNEQMALYAKEDYGVLIAFWDGESKGTKHMIDLANKHGLRVFVVEV